MVCSYLADFYSIWDATRINIFIMRRITVKSKSLARHSDDNGNNNDNDNGRKANLYYLLCTRTSHILFHCIFTEASGKVIILCTVTVLVSGKARIWSYVLWSSPKSLTISPQASLYQLPLIHFSSAFEHYESQNVQSGTSPKSLYTDLLGTLTRLHLLSLLSC